MSAVAVRAALGVKGLTPGVKFVLVVLAEHAHSTTHLSWPSAALVAEETGLARPTVASAMRTLRERGLIQDAGRVKQVIRYRVDPARLVALADVSSEREDVSPVVRHLSPVVTEPVISPDTEQEGTGRNLQGNLHATATAVVREWWEALPVKPAGRSAYFAAVNAIAALLKAGHDEAKVKRALNVIGAPVTIPRLEIALGRMGGRPAVSASGATEPQDEHFRAGGTW